MINVFKPLSLTLAALLFFSACAELEQEQALFDLDTDLLASTASPTENLLEGYYATLSQNANPQYRILIEKDQITLAMRCRDSLGDNQTRDRQITRTAEIDAYEFFGEKKADIQLKEELDFSIEIGETICTWTDVSADGKHLKVKYEGYDLEFQFAGLQFRKFADIVPNED